MSQIKIETIKNVDDAGRVARVHWVTRQKAYADILPKEYVAQKSFSDRERQWYSNIEKAGQGDGTIWIAQLNGFDAGFAAAGATRDEDLDEKKSAELYYIYVMPDYWGSGVGKKLFDKACDEMRSAKFNEITVWVYEPNAFARKFYERQGMKLTKATRPIPEFETYKVVRYSMPL
ncbi:MAG: GNAT family N-acetyltransferase [Candidatus Obscuribacterales bacterium]|nr:GNAT family N-acetyltransferase [Candidatus Obscuribacterales bacterium]